MLLIVFIIIMFNYIVFTQWSHYLLSSAGDLSRLSYDLSYRTYHRHTVVEKMDTLLYSPSRNAMPLPGPVLIATQGDSFFNCSCEGTCIQNYFDFPSSSILHLDISARPEPLIQYLLSPQYQKSPPKYLIIERVERGIFRTMTPNYPSIWSKTKNDNSYTGKYSKTNIIEEEYGIFKGNQLFSFINSANVKLMVSNMLGYFPDTYMISKAKSILLGIGGMKAELQKPFFSIHPNMLFYTSEDYKTKIIPDHVIKNIVDNYLFLQAQLEPFGTKLVIAIMPDKLSIYGPYLKKPIYKKGYQKLISALKEQGIIALDIQKFINENIDIKDFYQPDDTHFSRKGAQRTGMFIGDEIRKLGSSQ